MKYKLESRVKQVLGYNFRKSNKKVDCASHFCAKFKNNRLIIKSNKNADLIDYAEKTGNEPFLFIGEVINEKNWMYCIN